MRRLLVSVSLGLAALWLLAAALPLRAQQVLPVPALSGRVIDQTATLSNAQRDALENKLAAFEREAGSQVVVLLVPTTQPEDIASYANRVANEWKIGRRDIGDGLLIIVAKNDRRVRIEVAKTLEGAIPDLAARQVIDRAITPAFRAGDFAGGLNAAVDQVAARIRGEALPAPSQQQPGTQTAVGELGWEALAIFFFVAVPILGAVLTGILGRRLGSLATAGAAGGIGYLVTASLLIGAAAAFAALMLIGVFGIGSATRGAVRGTRHGGPPIIWGGGGSSWGGGGGWSGGGGFSSGGGGDFGGGGASGSW
jgi:uncharacterized protein